MGRYYNGDIEGKFLFAIQSSDAADQFGFVGEPPETIRYFFEKYHIPDIEEGIANLQAKTDMVKVQAFFNQCGNTYSREDYEKFGITWVDIRNHADWLLGNQILECVQKQDHCYFDAEC